jgi:hypothetical protein
MPILAFHSVFTEVNTASVVTTTAKALVRFLLLVDAILQFLFSLCTSYHRDRLQINKQWLVECMTRQARS